MLPFAFLPLAVYDLLTAGHIVRSSAFAHLAPGIGMESDWLTRDRRPVKADYGAAIH